MAAFRAEGKRVIKKAVHKWIPLPSATPKRVYAMTPQGRGYIWDGTPLVEQIRRDRIAVCFDDGKAATYYRKCEISFEKEKP